MAMYSLGHPKSRSVILKYPFHALTHLRMQNVLFDTYLGNVPIIRSKSDVLLKNGFTVKRFVTVISTNNELIEQNTAY